MTSLRTFKLVPAEAEYASEESADQFKRNQLDGGAGRYRRDIAGASRIVTCKWVLGPSAYEYIRTFFRVFNAAPEPFLIDLVIDEAALLQSKAWFMPGTFRLSEKRGLVFTCTAQLEVETPLYDPQFDTDILDVEEAFGSDWRLWLDRLDVVVNEKIPRALRGWSGQ